MAEENSVGIGCGNAYPIVSTDDTAATVKVLLKASEESDCSIALNRGDISDPATWKRVRNGDLLPGDARQFHVKLRRDSDLLVACAHPDEEVPEPTCSFTFTL